MWDSITIASCKALPLPRLCLFLLALSAAAPAGALTLSFPGPATETSATVDPATSWRLPIGPWDGQTIPARVIEGQVERRAWRLDGTTPTLALFEDLRAQLRAAGFRILFECDTAACGGFDFRFATEVLPEPDMHVDLGDFRVLSADRGEESVSLIVSRSSRAGFVQMTVARPGLAPAPPPALADTADEGVEPTLPTPALPGVAETRAPRLPGAAPPDPANRDLVARLIADGHAVLDDLRFASGAGGLESGDYPTLVALAGWLQADPARKVALVGHTDAAGSLGSNISLSKARAAAVRAALVGLGAAPAQVIAQGVGYLSPRATNATDAGRQSNRRVEAVLIATE